MFELDNRSYDGSEPDIKVSTKPLWSMLVLQSKHCYYLLFRLNVDNKSHVHRRKQPVSRLLTLAA